MKIYQKLTKNKYNLILLCIVVLAAFTRLYNLWVVPPSASLDEVSIGWNAYSILKTGVDEYGTKYPILLRAYDDWRPALYVYLVIPFIALLGLTVLAVRLPSVILSLLTIIAIYFLVKELVRQEFKITIQNLKSSLEIGNWKLEIALLSAALLAISPWHIYISRLGHEANAGLAFIIFGILFFLKAKNFNIVRYYSKKIFVFFSLSLIFFSLSLYTYQSTKVFVPLFLVALVVIYRKELLRIKKYFLLSLIAFALFTLPILFASLSSNALIRFSGTSVFNNHPLYEINTRKFIEAKENGDIINQIINNRRFTSLYIFTNQYLSHFSPEWMFGNGGNEAFKTPGVGLFYLWQLPFMIIGVIFILIDKFSNKIKALIFSWIAFSFVAPAITTEVPHAMRAYNVLPAFILIIAIGLVKGISLINKDFIKKIIILGFSLIAIVEFINFSKSYFGLFAKQHSASFQYALAKSILFVVEQEGSYEKIVFSNEKNLYQSYMFFLFYTKYDPLIYQQQGGTRSGGFSERHNFGKYEFRPIDWEHEDAKERTLYIGNSSDFSQDTDFTPVYYLDGKIGIKIAESRHEQ